MKIKLLILMTAFMAVGCGGTKFVVERDPCDGIVNRPNEQVCGKDRVRKNCQPFNATDGKPANTCEAL